MQILWRLNLVNVILEGDALAVVQVVHRSEENPSKHGHMVEELKHFINAGSKWQIQAVKRDCNKVAHLLAENALLCNNVVDLESVPGCISSIIMTELFFD